MRYAPEFAAELPGAAVTAVTKRDQVAAGLLLADRRVGQMVRADAGLGRQPTDLTGGRERQLRLRPPGPVPRRLVGVRAEPE